MSGSLLVDWYVVLTPLLLLPILALFVFVGCSLLYDSPEPEPEPEPPEPEPPIEPEPDPEFAQVRFEVSFEIQSPNPDVFKVVIEGLPEGDVEVTSLPHEFDMQERTAKYFLPESDPFGSVFESVEVSDGTADVDLVCRVFEAEVQGTPLLLESEAGQCMKPLSANLSWRVVFETVEDEDGGVKFADCEALLD